MIRFKKNQKVQADADFVQLLQEVLKLNPAALQDEQELQSLTEWDSMSHLVIASWTILNQDILFRRKKTSRSKQFVEASPDEVGLLI